MSTVRAADPLRNDAALEHYLRSKLRRAYPGRTVASLNIQRHGSVQMHRGIIEVHVVWKDRSTTTVFGNFDVGQRARHIFLILRHLEQKKFIRAPRLAPRALWYDARYGLCIYEELPGQRVRDLVEKRKLSSPQLRRIIVSGAAWLRAFHALPVISAVGPAPRPRLKKLYAPVRRANTVFPSSLVHGDPHLANYIFNRRGGGFIDYSETHRGSRLADVGMFLVHLDVALEPFFSRKSITSLKQDFVTSYFQRPWNKLSSEVVSGLNTYQAVAAETFLYFSRAYHPRPRGYMAWLTTRLQSLSEQALAEKQGERPIIIW